MRTQSAEKKKMRVLNPRERQITERKQQTRICPLTAIVNELVNRGIFHGDETVKLYVCGHPLGDTARYGNQSGIVEQAASTPCPLPQAEQCDLYLDHLGYKVETVPKP